ncbi:hypothetical protein KQS06HV_91232 [Klebsiella quasipneumoniae subsp. similipneumoniae]|nr:hypothetical protein KQS06HV_91232 [Klebsiella quasipneumoniae subsp. similipneumoniae]
MRLGLSRWPRQDNHYTNSNIDTRDDKYKTAEKQQWMQMHYKIPHTIPSLIQPLQTKGILNKVDDFYIFSKSFGKQGGFTDRHAIIGVFIGQGI